MARRVGEGKDGATKVTVSGVNSWLIARSLRNDVRTRNDLREIPPRPTTSRHKLFLHLQLYLYRLHCTWACSLVWTQVRLPTYHCLVCPLRTPRRAKSESRIAKVDAPSVAASLPPMMTLSQVRCETLTSMPVCLTAVASVCGAPRSHVAHPAFLADLELPTSTVTTSGTHDPLEGHCVDSMVNQVDDMVPSLPQLIQEDTFNAYSSLDGMMPVTKEEAKSWSLLYVPLSTYHACELTMSLRNTPVKNAKDDGFLFPRRSPRNHSSSFPSYDDLSISPSQLGLSPGAKMFTPSKMLLSPDGLGLDFSPRGRLSFSSPKSIDFLSPIPRRLRRNVTAPISPLSPRTPLGLKKALARLQASD